MNTPDEVAIRNLIKTVFIQAQKGGGYTKETEDYFLEEYAKAYAPVLGKEEMYNMLVYARKELNLLLQDEDLDDRKLREASEDLLPSLHDKINSLILSFTPSTKQSNEQKRKCETACDWPDCTLSGCVAKQSNVVQQAAKEVPDEFYPIYKYQRLFNKLREWNFIALQSEMDDLIQIVNEDFLAGASFNSDAVEFAEWIGKEDLKLYAEGWCQPGGSNGFHYSTQDLYILFRSDKNKNSIQQAHDKSTYE